MKIDPYKHKERYLKWREDGSKIEGLSKQNSELLVKYIRDMEVGLNVASSNKKGPRSFNRLNNIRQRLTFLIREIENRFAITDITQLEESQLFSFFNDMRIGVLKRKDGKTYQSVVDFVRYFKAFWRWWMKVNRKKGVGIVDITLDLDTNNVVPNWVYLTEEQVQMLAREAKHNYKVLIWFLFDTGIRAPTELMNVRVCDITEVPGDFPMLRIRGESSKTFGRDVKLTVSYDLLKEYIKLNGLKEEDPVFQITPSVVNKYLQRLAKRLFGEGVTRGGEYYSKLTMYDIRHCSSCYWVNMYNGNEVAIKQRFGWKKSDKIYYYTKFLGIEDPLKPEDLIKGTTKTEIEKKLIRTEAENSILKERIEALESKMVEIDKLVNTIRNNNLFKP